MPPNAMNVNQAMQSAIRHHQAGRLTEAERIYRQVLATQPNHAQAIHLLGALAYQRGNLAVAIDHFRRVIELNPKDADASYNLANALRDSGRLDESIAAFQRAIQ